MLNQNWFKIEKIIYLIYFILGAAYEIFVPENVDML